MRIAFFEIQDWERPFLGKGLEDFDTRQFKETSNESNVDQVKDFEVISVFIYSSLNRNIIDKLTKARLIATRSTGFDHIDLQACKKRGILVCNVPLYGEVTVAEHTFALILSLSRMIHDSYQRTRQGEFTCEGVQGFDLNGKTLGVLGTGRIGSKVIEIAKGFKMNVLAFDRFPNWNLANALGFKYTEWPNLLA